MNPMMRQADSQAHGDHQGRWPQQSLKGEEDLRQGDGCQENSQAVGAICTKARNPEDSSSWEL